jgi:two-component system cell cycle sensor histidine kinase/response regulator CckA
MMKDEDKSRAQLIEELRELRGRVESTGSPEVLFQLTGGTPEEGENFYRILAESAQDLIFIIDGGGYVKYVNGYAARYLGSGPEELIGRHLGDLFPPEAYEMQRASMQKVFESGSPYFIEEGFSFAERRIWLDTRLIPLRDKKGEVKYVLGISRDTTERKRTEEALVSAEAKFRSLVEQSLVGICIIHDEKFHYVNPKFEEILGYTAQEILAFDSIYDIIAEEDRKKMKENIARRLRGEMESIHYTLKCRRKDSAMIDVEVLGTRTEYRGKPAVITSVLDITDRKKMESEFQKAQRIESVGILAGGIAHEFNNILTAINGNIMLAKMYAKPGLEVFDILVEAEKACKRAEDLTRQLLTFSKGGTFFRKKISLRQIIEDLAGDASAGSNIVCVPDLPQNLWAIEGDEGQIRQAISNLLVNAREAMPGGGVIKIRAENVTSDPGSLSSLKEGAYVRVSVEDQGSGIEEDCLEKIFDPFFTTKEKGSGLGLTGALSIARNHDGDITVESRAGSGTTFHVYLPAFFGAATEPSSEGGVAITDRKKVLVMDDEEMIRNVVERMLGQCGCEATFARDGEEMLTVYERAMESGLPFDAVIVDLIIAGGMGGKEAMERLLQIDPGARAIVSSGYSDDPIMADFRKYGFTGVLAKPYQLSGLRKALREVISGGRT